MGKIRIRFLILFSLLAFLLVLFSGCAILKGKKGHLSASVEDFEYSPSSGIVEVYIQVENDGGRDIDSYEVHYRVAYDSTGYDDKTRGLNLNAGESREDYAVTLIGTAKTISDVSVTDIKWEVK